MVSVDTATTRKSGSQHRSSERTLLASIVQKLALGTAQFGLPYGVANRTGVVTSTEGRLILDEALARGIDTLDTAVGYGESEEVLGRLNVAGFRVVSKLPGVPNECSDVGSWFLGQLQASLHRLGVSALDGFLLHRPAQLMAPGGDEIYSALVAAKDHGLIKKIGVSIYEPSELDALFLHFDFDIVQVPLNLLDRRFTESDWSANLRARGVEVHSRSCFLQGLLLMPPAERPARFARFDPFWSCWDAWLKDSGLSALQACLRFSLSLPGIDRVVVGVDSCAQLREIIEAAEGPLPDYPTWPVMPDPLLLNPSSWNSL